MPSVHNVLYICIPTTHANDKAVAGMPHLYYFPNLCQIAQHEPVLLDTLHYNAIQFNSSAKHNASVKLTLMFSLCETSPRGVDLTYY